MKTTIQRGVTATLLAVITAGTLGLGAPQPVQAKGFIRRHPFVTGAAVVGGAMMYRHHQKKKARKRARAMMARPVR